MISCELIKTSNALYIPFSCYNESRQPASTFGQPYCTDIALLSHHIWSYYYHIWQEGEGGGGLPDLKRENVHHVRNFISATPLHVPCFGGICTPKVCPSKSQSMKKKKTQRDWGDLIQKIWCICRTSTDGCTECTSYRGPGGIVWIWFKEVE